jgi:hypothetical protein
MITKQLTWLELISSAASKTLLSTQIETTFFVIISLTEGIVFFKKKAPKKDFQGQIFFTSETFALFVWLTV